MRNEAFPESVRPVIRAVPHDVINVAGGPINMAPLK